MHRRRSQHIGLPRRGQQIPFVLTEKRHVWCDNHRIVIKRITGVAAIVIPDIVTQTMGQGRSPCQRFFLGSRPPQPAPTRRNRASEIQQRHPVPLQVAGMCHRQRGLVKHRRMELGMADGAHGDGLTGAIGYLVEFGGITGSSDIDLPFEFIEIPTPRNDIFGGLTQPRRTFARQQQGIDG